MDMQKLREAWDFVRAKNDTLRARFVEVDVDLPMSFAQVVCQFAEGYWHAIELSHGTNLKEEIESIIPSTIARTKEGELLHLNDIRHGGDQYIVLSIAARDIRRIVSPGSSSRCLGSASWKPRHKARSKTNSKLILNKDGRDAERCWKTRLAVLGLCESAEVIMTNWVIRRLYWRLNWMILLVMSVMHTTDTE